MILSSLSLSWLATLVLALAIGYLIGRYRAITSHALPLRLTRDLRRAEAIANAFEQTAMHIRKDIAQVTHANPPTTLSSQADFSHALDAQFALMVRYNHTFSLALLEADRPSPSDDFPHLTNNDESLRRLARLVAIEARQTDVVAHYGHSQLALLMPSTDAEGACLLAERMRIAGEHRLPTTVSTGVAVALDGDTPDSLLTRAQSALEAAQRCGGNAVFQHDGLQAQSVWEEVASTA